MLRRKINPDLGLGRARVRAVRFMDRVFYRVLTGRGDKLRVVADELDYETALRIADDVNVNPCLAIPLSSYSKRVEVLKMTSRVTSDPARPVDLPAPAPKTVDPARPVDLPAPGGAHA